MDIGRCNVIYLDRRSQKTGLVKRDDLKEFVGRIDSAAVGKNLDEEIVKQNLQSILATFNDVYICADGQSCLRRLSQMEDPISQPPTLLLIDIPDNDESHIVSPLSSNPPSMGQQTVEKNEPFDLYGIHMLSHICSSIQQRSMSRLIIPIAVTVNAEAARAALEEEPSLWALSKCSPDSVRGIKYLDIGAADVLTSPISPDRVQGLTSHAYRIFKEYAKEDTSSILTKRNRKLSWIGLDEERPFAYLREAMVSGLMVGICNPETINDTFDPSDLRLEEGRKVIVENAVGSWSFSAHDFTSDELVHAARVMLQHALAADELHRWTISSDDLTIFIMACRKAYNDFVLYHNFRHVVDVLQAIFFFLLRIGLLPPYQVEGKQSAKPSNAIAAVLRPFDALTLLVAALGHDVGHPGVNNAFLVALNAPLAQLYNDRSVLEAFHCAAYSQILRKYWPAAFDDMAMRKLMITTILATDMGLHFKYMKEMSSLQEKLAAAQSTADGYVPKVTDENRDLVCGLLIKCADISNVARKYACAAQWARVLTDEFANQGAMEKELNLPTCLFGGPPDPNDFLKLAESQLGFMNIFARPLFEGVSAVLPEMRFTLAELSTNKAIWQERIEAENSRKMSFARGPLSPLSRSTATPSETDSIDQRERLSPNPGESDSNSTLGAATKDRSRSGVSLTQQASEISLPNIAEHAGATTPHQTTRTPGITIPAYLEKSPLDMLTDHIQVIETGRRHSSVYSGLHDDETAKHNARNGSIDPLATTIFVQTHPSPAAREILDISAPPSPVKSVVSHSHVDASLPSSRSQATSTAEAGGQTSPSTKASSVGDDASEPPKPSPFTTHKNRSEDFGFLKQDPANGIKHQTMSVYGPDLLAKAASSPGKNSSASQVTAGLSPNPTGQGSNISGGSDDGRMSPGEHGAGDKRPDLRSSRSQSMLKGLKFWKKHKGERGEGLGVETP
ncbi:3'5'-cyclic nucleotide phosphodiesterase-like protein [Elsinoe fawcettii]|nr:3'5'-cyclic nucleotide phosphodiesterase-like protein [Elsinoe fawcettii]